MDQKTNYKKKSSVVKSLIYAAIAIGALLLAVLAPAWLGRM